MTGEQPLPPLVGLPEIRAAAVVLRGIAVHTPLVPFGRPERRHWLKAESLQPIGAFKLRGAYVAAASLTPEERSRGLITYSSGNHAQGVARAARLFGVPAVIVMPSDSPALKRARVEADGAEVVIVGTASEERRRVAEEIAEARGLAIIPPYDDPRIVAGQGTAGLEIAEDMPDVAAVLVPIGGGGLASGVAAAIKALLPRTLVIGVEPELAADARESLAAGRIVEWPAERVSRTIADGTRTQSIGRLNFAHLSVAARCRGDGVRGGDRRCRPPRRRGGTPRGGAVGCADGGGHALPGSGGRADGRRWTDRGRRLRRQRGPGPLPGLPRSSDPARGVATAGAAPGAGSAARAAPGPRQGLPVAGSASPGARRGPTVRVVTLLRVLVRRVGD